MYCCICSVFTDVPSDQGASVEEPTQIVQPTQTQDGVQPTQTQNGVQTTTGTHIAATQTPMSKCRIKAIWYSVVFVS